MRLATFLNVKKTLEMRRLDVLALNKNPRGLHRSHLFHSHSISVFENVGFLQLDYCGVQTVR